MTQPSRNETVVDLFARAVQLGIDVARAASRKTPAIELPRTDLGQLPMPSLAAPCEIPPPCWAPRSAGEITSVVCEGAEAVLRVRVTNCDYQRRDLTIDVPEDVQADPAKVSLGPMERATVTLS